jgi:ABC-type proline/glycine betaine transport systems, ATPase components
MEHLRKEYPNGKMAVDDFNLQVDRGEFICFIGTSGSGKTTTMRMINRMLSQTSGTIKINGKDISQMDPVKLRRSIGYVIQNVGLMPHMTIQENIELVPKLLGWEPEKRAEQAHKMIQLPSCPTRCSNVTRVSCPGGNSSGSGSSGPWPPTNRSS